MSKFTKGKWSWKRFRFAEHLDRGDQIIEIYHLTGSTSAKMIAHIDSELLACSALNDEDEANACLIAAAPDLYKGCEIAEECFRKLGNCKAEALNEYAKTVLKDNARLLRQVLAKAKPKE